MGLNPVAATSTSDIASVLSKEFLQIHTTTVCRFTLKWVCDMIKAHSPQSPCHPGYIFEYVCPHTFHVNFLLKRHITCGHRISCTFYHMERTDNKPFSGLIGPSMWLQVGQLPIKAGRWDVPITFCNLAKAFKHYYIFGFHFPEAIKTIIMIHYCYCLMVSGKWRRIIYWKADYIILKL